LSVVVFSAVIMSPTARTAWSQWPTLGVLVKLSMPHVAFVGRYAFLTTKSCLTSHPTAPVLLHFARECMCVRCFVVLFGHGMVNSHACMMPTSNHIHTLVSINASPHHGVGPTREPKHRKNHLEISRAYVPYRNANKGPTPQGLTLSSYTSHPQHTHLAKRENTAHCVHEGQARPTSRQTTDSATGFDTQNTTTNGTSSVFEAL